MALVVAEIASEKKLFPWHWSEQKSCLKTNYFHGIGRSRNRVGAEIASENKLFTWIWSSQKSCPENKLFPWHWSSQKSRLKTNYFHGIGRSRNRVGAEIASENKLFTWHWSSQKSCPENKLFPWHWSSQKSRLKTNDFRSTKCSVNNNNICR